MWKLFPSSNYRRPDLIFQIKRNNLLHHVLSGRRVSKSPRPDQLQLRTGPGLLEPSPAVVSVLGDRSASSSPSGQTSASMTDHSRSGRSSPASPRVSGTRLRRSRCSGEPDGGFCWAMNTSEGFTHIVNTTFKSGKSPVDQNILENKFLKCFKSPIKMFWFVRDKVNL